MIPDLELTIHADDTQARRAFTGLHRALAAALARDRWNRTHCSAILAQTGRGVADNPVCAGRPVTGIRFSKAVREGLDAKRVTGFEADDQRPEPDTEVTSPLRRRG